MSSDPRTLFDKIQALPPERVAEVEDFVDFIASRTQDRFVVHAAMAATWVQGWRSAGLLKPSSIKPVFATLEHVMVLRQLGRLSVADQAALKVEIGRVIA